MVWDKSVLASVNVNTPKIVSTRAEMERWTREEKEQKLEEVLKSKSFVLNNTSLLSALMGKESVSIARTQVEQRTDDDDASAAKRSHLPSNIQLRQKSDQSSMYDQIMNCVAVPESFLSSSVCPVHSEYLVTGNVESELSTSNGVPKETTSCVDTQNDCDTNQLLYRSGLSLREHESYQALWDHAMLDKKKQHDSHSKVNNTTDPMDVDVVPGMELILDTVEEIRVGSKRTTKFYWRRNWKQKHSKGRRRKRRCGYSFAVLDV